MSISVLILTLAKVCPHTCLITLFLMLASDATMVTDGNEEDFKTKLSSSWAHNLMSFLLSWILKEIYSEKVSIILKPGENSELRGEKERKHL